MLRIVHFAKYYYYLLILRYNLRGYRDISVWSEDLGAEMLMIPVSGSVTIVTTRIMPWMPQITSQPPPLLLPDLATIPAVEDRAQFISKPLNDLFSIYINLYISKNRVSHQIPYSICK